jgi:hypothetical protein
MKADPHVQPTLLVLKERPRTQSVWSSPSICSMRGRGRGG